MSATHTFVRAAHEEAVRELTRAPTYAPPVPMASDLRDILERVGVSMSLDEIREACFESGLGLSDTEADSADITRRIQIVPLPDRVTPLLPKPTPPPFPATKVPK